MAREPLLARLDDEWRVFLQTFAGLADDRLTAPGVVGEWSLRDLLGHVSTWEDEFLKALPLILDGRPFPRYGGVRGIDAFNAREQERKRRLTLDKVKRELTDTHQRLLSALEKTPELSRRSENRLRRRLRLDTYGHYRLHAAQIRAWRGAAALP